MLGVLQYRYLDLVIYTDLFTLIVIFGAKKMGGKKDICLQIFLRKYK